MTFFTHNKGIKKNQHGEVSRTLHASSFRRFFLFGVSVLLIASLISPLLAFTASAKIDTATPADEAKSTSYYRLLRECVRGNMYGTIQLSASDNGVATPGKWFDDNNAFGFVYPTGKIDCKAAVKPALELWGWGSDYSAFLKDMGYTYNSSTVKWEGPGNGETRQVGFDAAVQRKYYTTNFAGDPSQSQAARYEMFLNVFQKACGAKSLGPVANITNNSYKTWLNDATKDKGREVEQGLAGVPGTVSGPGVTFNVFFSKVDIVEKVDGEYKKVPYGYVYQSPLAAGGTWYGGSGNVPIDTENVKIYGHHSRAVERSCHDIQKGVTENAGAWALWAASNPDDAIPPVNNDDGTPGSTEEQPTTCVIDSVGWFVCPIVGFAAGMSDALYGWITSYLTVQPLNVNTGAGDNTMYIAWNIMRNLANVAFVILFIFIIYSQLTSTGISNYGVKKALPRLIVAAVLVNLSYWIAAAAVDISNIVGNNLYNVLRNLPLGNVTGESLGWEAIAAWFLAAGAIGTAAVAGIPIIAGAGAAGVGLLAVYALIPIVIAVVLALILAFVILALRQALIIVMIVIAPLAFVALLLPNTEKFFKMWQKSLTTLLVFYPLFSLLFGGSYIAGMIIIGSAGQGESSAVGVTILIGMAITTLPLFLTPMIMKFSSGIMGSTASMLNGKFKNNALSRSMKGLRNRKASLAMGEGFNRTRPDGTASRNPFSRAYRAIQNNRQADEVRKENIGKSNKAAYLETTRSGTLDAQGKALGERIKTSEAHHEEAHERNVTNSPNLMALRQRQDASTRATADYKAQQGEFIQNNLSAQSLSHDFSRTNAEERTKVAKDTQMANIKRAQDADASLKNIALQQAAVTGELNQIDKDRKRIVTQAGTAEGGANLAAQGFDAPSIRTIQDTNNAIADTDLHIAHNEAQTTAETVVRQANDDSLTQVKLATEAAKQVKVGDDKQFETLVGATKTAEGRAALEAQGLVSGATAASFADSQATIADSDVSIARSSAEGVAETAARQSTDMDIMNDKLATEAANRDKKVLDDQFGQVVAEATSQAGGAELEARGYDANIIDQLQSSQVNTAIASAATNAAQRVQQDEFTTAVRNNDTLPNGSTITEAMAGIDTVHGEALATAQAIESQRRARESNVSAFGVQFKDAGTPVAKLFDLSQGIDRDNPGRIISAEERDAAGRGIVESGDIDAIKPYTEYLSTALEKATSPAEVAVIQDLQKSYAERIGSSPGKPLGIGAPEIANMRDGNYIRPAVATAQPLTQVQAAALNTTDNVQTFNTVMNKGVPAQKWATIDKSDIGTITRLVQAGVIPPERLETLRASLITAKKDPRISNLIQEREARLLDTLSNEINAILPKGPKKGN